MKVPQLTMPQALKSLEVHVEHLNNITYHLAGKGGGRLAPLTPDNEPRGLLNHPPLLKHYKASIC